MGAEGPAELNAGSQLSAGPDAPGSDMVTYVTHNNRFDPIGIRYIAFMIPIGGSDRSAHRVRGTAMNGGIDHQARIRRSSLSAGHHDAATK